MSFLEQPVGVDLLLCHFIACSFTSCKHIGLEDLVGNFKLFKLVK